MRGLLLYPYFLVVFWYHDFFVATLKKSYEIFIYVSNLLSVPLLLSTFFKPLKSEYREGFVFISVLIGMVVKSIILIVAFCILLILLGILLAIDLLVLLLPLLLIVFAFSPR